MNTTTNTQNKQDRILESYRRSYVQEIFLRNKQHNIGSHVSAKCSDVNFVEQLLEKIKKNESDYSPIYTPEFGLHPANQLAELTNYCFQRDSYCTDILGGTQRNRESVTIKNLFSFLDKNLLLLNCISGYFGIFKYHFEIYFDEEEKCVRKDDPRLENYQISIPNGLVGCHAFFNIVENFIRNTAKYTRYDDKDDIAICIRFRKEYSQRSFIGRVKYVPISDDYYVVEIYSNVSQNELENLVAKQNEYIRLPIIEENTLKKRTIAKGLVEMAASAAYLRDDDILKIDIDSYTPKKRTILKDYMEHLSIFDKNGNELQLKAFGLSITPRSKIHISVIKQIFSNGISSPVFQLNNSSGNLNYYHYLSEGEQTVHQGFLGYRFFMLKPKKVLFVGNDTAISKQIPSGYGIDFWTSDQLEQHIKDKKNVAYEIMVCGDTHLVSKHKSRLPKRIICQTPADFFCEFKNSCSKSLSDVEGVLPEIEGFAWKKYTESRDYTHKTIITDSTNKASFLDHDKKVIFDKNNTYIEALSSAAQQKLPGWFELAKKPNGTTVTPGDLSDYIANVRRNDLPKNRLLESINTRVFMLDENLQSTAKSTFPFGDTERSLLTHLKKCQILFPDCDLSEISPSDFLNIMRDIKVKGYEKPYDFIFFHYGLLERMFEQMGQNELKELQTMYPEIDIDNSNKKALMVEYLNLLAKEHDVVVKSGRGVPESLPSTVRFVHQISVDQALVEIKSKYLFSNLLYSSRSK